MKVFQYTDNSVLECPVLLAEIAEDNILEADKLLEEFCGVKASKASFVVCAILQDFTFELLSNHAT